MDKKEKITLVVDSSCGLTKKEIEKMGYEYISISINLNNVEYLDGDTMTEHMLINNLTPGDNILTSSPSPGQFAKAYERALQKADKVICITLSQKLSSTNQNAKNAVKLNKRYEGNVFVPDSFYIGPWFKSDLLLFDKMIKSGVTVEDILFAIEETNDTALGAFCVDTLIYLKNGGRISNAQAIIGNVLKILPIVYWEDGHMVENKVQKSRTFSKAQIKTIKILYEEYKELRNKNDYKIFIITSPKISGDEYNHFLEKVQNLFDFKYLPENRMLGASLVSHLGPNFIGLGLEKKHKEIK